MTIISKEVIMVKILMLIILVTRGLWTMIEAIQFASKRNITADFS
jgi:hypothetical protein